jgi:succinoglycan biosynthesis protein ExoA
MVRSSREESPSPLPFISVIVPVRNEAAFIHQTLEQLVTQNYDPDRFEVLVADGLSNDGTPMAVRSLALRYPNVRLVNNWRRWSSAGRNAALAQARGDFVVIVDGHCEVDNRDYLRNLADAFARSGADCIGRPQPLDVSNATVVQRAIALARSSPLGHHPESFIYSAQEQFVRPHSVAIAYRRSVFDRLGGFDETFDACEDVEFNHRVARAGLNCFFTPKVAVRYHPRGTLRGLFQQMARYGRGRVRLVRKHPDTFSVSCFLPALFLVGLAAGPLVIWLSTWLLLSYGTAVGLYALLVGAMSLVLTARARDLRLLPWFPPVFATIHSGAGFGILQELFARTRPRKKVRRSTAWAFRASVQRSAQRVAA